VTTARELRKDVLLAKLRRLGLAYRAKGALARRERHALWQNPALLGVALHRDGHGRGRGRRRELGALRHEARWKRVKVRARRRRVDLLQILENATVENQRDGGASPHARPVGRADERVAQHAVLAHVARADVAHARVSNDKLRLVLDGRGGAHDERAAGRGARAHDDGEARGVCRKRLGGEVPDDLRDVAARGALLGLNRLDLACAAVDAQRGVGVVDGVALRVKRRERLGALERDGGGVLLDVIRLGGSEELGAVGDEEVVKLLVEAVEGVPDLLVHLEAHGQLVLGAHVLNREAVERHLDRKGLERPFTLSNQAKGRARVRVRVDVAQLIAEFRHLEANGVSPLRRKGHDVLHLNGQLTCQTTSQLDRLTALEGLEF